MDDKIKINLLMGGNTYPLTILREDEELVRAAAKQVNIRINAYKELYPNLPDERVATMAAYTFAWEALKEKKRNDTAPYAEKVDELTDVLEKYMQGL